MLGPRNNNISDIWIMWNSFFNMSAYGWCSKFWVKVEETEGENAMYVVLTNCR